MPSKREFSCLCYLGISSENFGRWREIGVSIFGGQNCGSSLALERGGRKHALEADNTSKDNIPSSTPAEDSSHLITSLIFSTMKIQSSLLILAAMAGSAAAANKRKRVFKIYSREEIQAVEGRRFLQGGAEKQDKNEKNPQPEVVTVASMSMSQAPTVSPALALETIAPTVPASMSMATMTNCAFCYGKEYDASIDLNFQGQTCGTVAMAVSKLDATDPNCALAKQAESICCPDVITTAATEPAATTTAANIVATTGATEPATTTTEAAEVPAPTPPVPS